MIYAQLTEEEQKQLQDEIQQAQKVKWYRRLKIIEFSAQGFTVPQLANMFALSQATIRSYIHAYNENGLAGLRPYHSPGRAQSLKWSKAEWEDLLYQAPSDFEQLESRSKKLEPGIVETVFCSLSSGAGHPKPPFPKHCVALAFVGVAPS